MRETKKYMKYRRFVLCILLMTLTSGASIIPLPAQQIKIKTENSRKRDKGGQEYRTKTQLWLERESLSQKLVNKEIAFKKQKEDRTETDATRLDLKRIVASDDSLEYSTYYGGSYDDTVRKVLRASHGRYYFAGRTSSPDLPTTEGSYDRTYNHSNSTVDAVDAFLALVDIYQGELIFSTYFGGSDLDVLEDAALDSKGNVVLVGTTWSEDLPITQNAYQKKNSGNGDGFIAIMDGTGAKLLYCTYIGGSGTENLFDVELDDHDNIYLIGLTDSRDYPLERPIQSFYHGGDDDVFISMFDPTLSDMLASTYYGGNSWDEGFKIHVTSNRELIACGFTSSDNWLCTPDALSRVKTSNDEGFVLILSDSLRSIEYSTYIGWSMHEAVYDVHLDEVGVVTAFGRTTSPDLPTSGTSYQKDKGEYPDYYPNYSDYYVLRYNREDGDIQACSYFGAAGNEGNPNALLVKNDVIIIAGYGNTSGIPYTDTLSRSDEGYYVNILAVMDNSLTDLLYCPRIGGSALDGINAIDLDSNMIVLCGFTTSNDYPCTRGSLYDTLSGNQDGYLSVVKIDPRYTLGVGRAVTADPDRRLATIYPNPVFAGSIVHIEVKGQADGTLQLVDVLGRLVLKRSIVGTMSLPTAGLQPGVYFLSIAGEHEVLTQKLVVY